MLTVVLILISLFNAYLSRKSLATGAAFLLFTHMVIPPCARIASISFNTANLLILSIFCFHKISREKFIVNKHQFFPITQLLGPIAILAFFAPLSLGVQYSALVQFIITEVSIYIILSIAIRTQDELKQSVNAIVYSYILIGTYGLFTYFVRGNPLYSYFAKAFNASIDYTGGDIIATGGFLGRATGNLSGGLPWGQESVLICAFAFFYPVIENPKIRNLLCFLSCANCFFSTKRSAIVPMIVVLIYSMVKKGLFNKKNVIKVVLSVFVLFFAFSKISYFDSYRQNIESAIYFWDDDVARHNNIRGSSRDMRNDQLQYTFYMVKDNLLCGLGYSYNSYYNATHGSHPVMHGFESLFFSVVVCSGIIGFGIWILFFIRSYKLTAITLPRSDNFVLHSAYFLSLMLTGLQSSFFWYMVILVLIRKQGALKQCSFQ